MLYVAADRYTSFIGVEAMRIRREMKKKKTEKKKMS